MVNLKETAFGLGALCTGAVGAFTQLVQPVLANTYVADGSVILSAVFICLTAIGVKLVNKGFNEDEL